ncbi:MAG: DNA polymerase III subunit gamma/tau [Bacteroidales bacterium]|nr:DNA polymerase III subunit gamma/tau [Bacteroidales bacterium]
MENFIVSARKYRPATFDTVVGQKAITNTLINAIKNHHLAQAYLFTGPRGVGKTTSARIFAKTINCLNINLEKNPDQIEPCNVCESCLSFSQNASFNIMELDAASNNSVDDIRRLVDQVRIPPQVGKYKVYIIDEVHMLSQAAFNAFLKTLEEPPSYVKFILATTEKHKIIPTILSRCQVFDFKRISVLDIANYLKYVASKEKVEADEEALHLIAQKADGAMRDALSIFDQLVSFTSGRVTYQNVVENLHVLDYDYFFRITDQFLSGDITSVLVIYNEIIERGFDGQHFLIGLGEHLRNLLISRDTATIDLLETSVSIKQKYFENATRFSSAFLLKALDLNNQCDINYKSSNNKRLLIEIALMQMVALGSGIVEPVVPENIPAMPVKKKAFKEIASEPVPTPTPAAAPVVKPMEEVKQNPPIEVKAEASVSVVAEEKIDEKIEPVKMPRISKPVGLGISLKTEEKIKEEEVNSDAYMLGNEHIADVFTQEKLDTVLLKFIESIQSQPSLYATLKSNKAIMQDDFIVELQVYNEAQRSALTDKKFDLVKLLRQELNNYKINVAIKVIEAQESAKLFSPADKFNAMAQKNPNLNKLKENLSLELDF